PLAYRDRPARCACRVRPDLAGIDQDPRLGFDRRDPLPGRAHAARRHRRLVRRASGRPGHPRFHDRHRATRVSPGGRGVNGPHDLGGAQGFGPVRPEPDEPVFHAEWERRALALQLAMSATGTWSIDESRFARERTPPAEYLAASYYEKWMLGLSRL